MPHRIRHDRGWRGYRDGQSVVTTCDACPGRFAVLSLSERAAREAGEAHLENVHDVAPARAVAQRRQTEARRAASAARSLV